MNNQVGSLLDPYGANRDRLTPQPTGHGSVNEEKKQTAVGKAAASAHLCLSSFLGRLMSRLRLQTMKTARWNDIFLSSMSLNSVFSLSLAILQLLSRVQRPAAVSVAPAATPIDELDDLALFDLRLPS